MKYTKASPQRLQNWKNVGNRLVASNKSLQRRSSAPKPAVTIKRVLNPILDSPTRWSSTALMGQQGLTNRQLIDELCHGADADPGYQALAMADEEWLVIAKIVEFLEVSFV